MGGFSTYVAENLENGFREICSRVFRLLSTLLAVQRYGIGDSIAGEMDSLQNIIAVLKVDMTSALPNASRNVGANQ